MAPPPPTAGRGPAPLLVHSLLLLLCLLWGSTWLVIRKGLDELPPYSSAAWRFVVAGTLMALLAPLLRKRESGGPPPTLAWVVLGCTNFAISYAIVYRSEVHLPSGLSSVLWGVFPMLMAISGHLFLDERLRPAQWWGFGLGFAGLVLLFATDLQGFGPEGVPAALVLLCSPLVSTLGTTVVKRHASGASSLLLNRNALLLGAALLSLWALLVEGDLPRITWTPRAVLNVAYLAVFGTVVTFGIYFWLLRYAPAHRLSLIAYVTPAIALTLGWLVGDEPLTPTLLGGAGLILLGVVLVLRK